MIEVKTVDVIKSGRRLYENFSWQIKPGENWLVIGPNGGGKTLLLEMLSGMLHIPKGEIHYDFVMGNTWDERHAEKRRLITYIPAHALQLFLNGHDLFYQQRYYSLGDDHTPRVRDVLGEEVARLSELDIPDSLSVEHLLEVEVSRLSNGQLKKLLLVKSMLKGVPKLLLLDYPFEGLDHKSRENLSELIDFVANRHKVQVIIVDNQRLLLKCINRKLILNNFKIERVEPVNALMEANDALHPYLSESHSPDTGEEVIRISNLQLTYGKYEVFTNFNWLVRRGDRWALTGRNGAGKTTLFSLIFADHPQAYAQEIYLFGRRRGSGESIWDIKKRINYLGPEQITFLDSKSVTLSVHGYIKNVVSKFSNGLLEQLVNLFDADMLMSKPVNTLSSGELQLMMILICFLSDKELWLLDEPFQFLDPLQKANLTKYLSTHLKREITLILITHNDDDLAAWTDKRMQL